MWAASDINISAGSVDLNDFSLAVEKSKGEVIGLYIESKL